MSDPYAKDEEFSISREFAGPRELVFAAWSDPKHLAHWWGPKGFKMEVAKMDFRPGGTFHYGMSAPAGHPMAGTMWGRFVYREIVVPEKIVFVNSFSDAAGGITRHPMAPTWPAEVLNTQTFAVSAPAKTLVTLRGGPINASAEEHETFKKGFSSMSQGFAGTMDQLAEYLSTL